MRGEELNIIQVVEVPTPFCHRYRNTVIPQISSPSQSAVLFKDVCKGYVENGPVVLDNFCMNVEKGTLYTLLGASGCGKTTALSCIVGVKKWGEGEVLVFGKRPGTRGSGVPGKLVGYMPQETALYPHMSIKENIQYYGRLCGMSNDELEEKWAILTEMLQLSTKFKPVSSLSGGQKRRTSLALALAHHPPLLILDEPTVGLDPLLRERVWKHLYKLVESQQATIIITTHYIEESRHSDKIGVMRDGRLLVEDSPSILMARFQTDLLESVVLRLCWSETKKGGVKNVNPISANSGRESENIQDIEEGPPIPANKNIGRSESYNRPVYQAPGAVAINRSQNGAVSSHSSGQHSTRKREYGAKNFLANLEESIGRVKALSWVTYLGLIRHPIFFLVALILPAEQLCLNLWTLGQEPKGLPIAVLNEEIPDWVAKCPMGQVENLEIGPVLNQSSCNFNDLSCKFLKVLDHGDIINLKAYKSKEDVLHELQQGSLRGYLHFPVSYSEHLMERLATKQFALEEALEGSTVSLRVDMSEYIGSTLLIKHVYEGQEEFLRQLVSTCGLDARQVEIPLNFRKPVYGIEEGTYGHYMIPGVLTNIIFMFPFALSAMVFVTDLKLGTLGRAQVCGLSRSELVITFMITQGSIVIGQTVLCAAALWIVFSFQVVGSSLLYIGITIMTGLCGVPFGLLIGIICQDELQALITAMLILPFMLINGGVIWPMDCMTPTWRLIGSILPTTLITESLRSLSVRGLGISHILMWPGIAVIIGWFIVFWIGSLVAFKYLIK